jgi:hypothetical protein
MDAIIALLMKTAKYDFPTKTKTRAILKKVLKNDTMFDIMVELPYCYEGFVKLSRKDVKSPWTGNIYYFDIDEGYGTEYKMPIYRVTPEQKECLINIIKMFNSV